MPAYTRDGVNLAYDDYGSVTAPAVVLLHGFTSDRRAWHEIAGRLAKGRRVLVPDLRGHGESDAPADLSTYTMEAYAADLAALLDHLELEAADIVGSSFGGMVAMEFAVTWPQRARSLVLSDTSPAYDRPEYDERFRERERGVAKMVDSIARVGPLETGRRAARDASDEFVARAIRRRYERMNSDGIVGAAKARRERRDLTGELKSKLMMPVLLCMGSEDPVFSALAVMRRELPGARVVTFEGVGHGVPGRATARFIEAVEGFYRDVSSGKAVAAEIAL